MNKRSYTDAFPTAQEYELENTITSLLSLYTHGEVHTFNAEQVANAMILEFYKKNCAFMYDRPISEYMVLMRELKDLIEEMGEGATVKKVQDVASMVLWDIVFHFRNDCITLGPQVVVEIAE